MSFSFCFGGHITSVGEEALPEIREALRRSDAAILGSIPADRRTASCSALDRICSRGLARNGFNQTTEQAVVARGSQLKETAGAMNAVVLAEGHAVGGAEGARVALERFWRSVSRAALLSPFKRTPLDILLGRWTMDTSPAFIAADLMARVFSPYDLNPQDANPLREILAQSVDFERIARAPIRLFVTATNVRTGRGRVFRNADLTPDVLLASGCLPTLFQAIELDGEPYLDGGLAGNPTITPLVRECTASDTVLVQVNPIERPGTPRSARDIIDRLNEVSFNATLLKELRMMALLRQVADAGNCEGKLWARMRIHRIASAAMTDLGYSSKLNAEWAFLCFLREEGKRCAQSFL